MHQVHKQCCKYGGIYPKKDDQIFHSIDNVEYFHKSNRKKRVSFNWSDDWNEFLCKLWLFDLSKNHFAQTKIYAPVNGVRITCITHILRLPYVTICAFTMACIFVWLVSLESSCFDFDGKINGYPTLWNPNNDAQYYKNGCKIFVCFDA